MAYNAIIDHKRMDALNFHVEDVLFPCVFDFRNFYFPHRLFTAHSREQHSFLEYLLAMKVFWQYGQTLSSLSSPILVLYMVLQALEQNVFCPSPYLCRVVNGFPQHSQVYVHS